MVCLRHRENLFQCIYKLCDDDDYVVNSATKIDSLCCSLLMLVGYICGMRGALVVLCLGRGLVMGGYSSSMFV